jgi:hypothetical protein
MKKLLWQILIALEVEIIKKFIQEWCSMFAGSGFTKCVPCSGFVES